MSVYIIQCLCPNRHCIYGIAYDPEEIAHDVVMTGFQQLIQDWISDKAMNPWCGICESRNFTYEQCRTKFQTMEEARAELKKLELENLVSRLLIDSRKAETN